MMLPALDARQPLSEPFRDAIASRLQTFLAGPVTEQLAELGPRVEPLLAIARDAVSGGKRIRPAFCWWTYAAAGGEPTEAMLDAAATLEFLQASALVHDDILDGSNTRRGQPAAHRKLEALHRSHGWRGDAAAFGIQGGILLGNLLAAWSGQMWDGAGLDGAAADRARVVLDTVRAEVNAGQFLDVVAEYVGSQADTAVTDAERVVEFKTARYTVVRPCQIGAALAGADEATVASLQHFGSLVGRAFQLQDDLLGVFGDSAITGKPAGDDIREGKRTVLVAEALRALPQPELLDHFIGNPDIDAAGLEQARELIAASGARERVQERMMADYHEGIAVLDTLPLTGQGRAGLQELARLCVERNA